MRILLGLLGKGAVEMSPETQDKFKEHYGKAPTKWNNLNYASALKEGGGKVRKFSMPGKELDRRNRINKV